MSLYRCADYGGTAGYCVGDARQSDWLAYTVNNPETANYVVEVRARSAPTVNGSCTFHLEWGGTTVATFTVSFPDYNWLTVTATANLTAGINTLKLVFDTANPANSFGFFDYMTIYKQPPAPPNPGSTVSANLLAGSDVPTARGNATSLQNAINSLGSAGGTVVIPNGVFHLCQPNPTEETPLAGGGAQLPLVAAVGATGTLRNNYTGYVGFQFQVGPTALTVTKLGRWVVSGNSGTHWVKLVNQNGTDVYEGGGSVNTSGQAPNAFAYAPFGVGGTITLTANTVYYVLSQETSGGDQWCDVTPAAVGPNQDGTILGSATGDNGSYTITQNGSFSCGPISLLYQAATKEAAHNYAVLIGTNNITIKGTAPGTTLVAQNRDTTIFYIGSGYTSIQPRFAVTNILLSNITFQGNPTTDLNFNYNTNGIMRAYQGYLTQSDVLGSLVVVGGYLGMTTNYCRNVAIQGCNFYLPTDTCVSLFYNTDVVITNCSFTYFTSIPPSLANSLWAWCAIKAAAPQMYDVAVQNCSFNGNASMQSGSDYAADGLVWLPNGGGWIVENCAITNYLYEAVQFNAGPYTVVSNAYCTLCASQIFRGR